jgi:hypothetical protein
VLAGFDQLFCLAQSGGIDEHHSLFFRSGVEEIGSHSPDNIAIVSETEIEEGNSPRYLLIVQVNRISKPPALLDSPLKSILKKPVVLVLTSAFRPGTSDKR